MAAQVISFNCILKNRFGQLISTTTNREVVTSVGQFCQLKSLASALVGLVAGEKRTVSLEAKDAYGFYDPKLSITRNRRDLHGGEELKKGEVVKYARNGELTLYRVTEANSISITLDANHPLAGQDLVFEIEATEAREAMPEEVLETLTESPSKYLN